jgi:hypothetical protein
MKAYISFQPIKITSPCMTIKKLRKIKDENIISSVEKRVRVSFFFMAASFFSYLSFLLSDGKTKSPYSY